MHVVDADAIHQVRQTANRVVADACDLGLHSGRVLRDVPGQLGNLAADDAADPEDEPEGEDDTDEHRRHLA